MRPETIALHSGFDCDPTTKSVAVPIYQTVAYAFDSAAHGAALFDLEVEGYRYSRIANPTNTVLERRVADLEGGADALSVSTGQAAVHFAVLAVTEAGRTLVSVPQLYGTTHTLLAHILPKLGVRTRFARSDKPADLAALIDESTSAVFCETVGNPAGNVCDLEAIAEVAHRAGVPLIVDNTVPTPILIRPIDYGADVVVHSLTKFLGGHGTTLGGIIVAAGKFPWQKYGARFLPWARLHRALRAAGLHRPLSQRLSKDHGRGAAAAQRLSAAARHRDGGSARGASRRECAAGRGIPACRPARRLRQLRGLPGQPVLCAGAEISRRARLLAAHLRDSRRLR